MDGDDLYQQVILDHFRNPRNQRKPSDGELQVDGLNPACGDKILLSGSLVDGKVGEIHYMAHGCAVSVASASLMSEACRGLDRVEIEGLSRQVSEFLAGAGAAGLPPGDLAALASLRRFPMRHKCALLPWRALLDWMAKASAAQ